VPVGVLMRRFEREFTPRRPFVLVLLRRFRPLSTG
jgi:hypothetical protein